VGPRPKGFRGVVQRQDHCEDLRLQRDLKGTGKSRRITIASTAELKFAEAKDRARKLLLDMRGGKDPKAKPKTGTLQETLDAYLSSGRLSPRSQQHYSGLVRIQLASLKDRLLGSITPDEVDHLHRSIEGKTAANDALKCLRMLHRYAAARDDELGRCPVRLRKNEGTELSHAVIPFRRNAWWTSMQRCRTCRRWARIIGCCCYSPACEGWRRQHCDGMSAISSVGLSSCRVCA
jgi:hypothetical protein